MDYLYLPGFGQPYYLSDDDLYSCINDYQIECENFEVENRRLLHHLKQEGKLVIHERCFEPVSGNAREYSDPNPHACNTCVLKNNESYGSKLSRHYEFRCSVCSKVFQNQAAQKKVCPDCHKQTLMRTDLGESPKELPLPSEPLDNLLPDGNIPDWLASLRERIMKAQAQLSAEKANEIISAYIEVVRCCDSKLIRMRLRDKAARSYAIAHLDLLLRKASL